MTNTLCFVDIDGVLADFVDAAFERHNIRTPWAEIRWDFVEQAGLNPKHFWSSLGFEFWKSLRRTLECSAITRATETKFGKENVFLCSSPCKTPGCAAGKAVWVDLYLPPGYCSRLILTNRKEVFSGPGRVLIDDRDENIQEWVKAGGTGVLVPRPWNQTRNTSRDVSDIVVKAIEAV